MRANSVHLSEDQMWDMVKYIIENKGVTQDENGDFLKFRVSKKLLAEELSKLHNLKLGLHQIDKMIAWHAKICNLFGNKMISPPAQESVEEDRLKVENVKLKEELKLRLIDIEKLQYSVTSGINLMNSYKLKFEQIKNIVK